MLTNEKEDSESVTFQRSSALKLKARMCQLVTNSLTVIEYLERPMSMSLTPSQLLSFVLASVTEVPQIYMMTVHYTFAGQCWLLFSCCLLRQNKLHRNQGLCSLVTATSGGYEDGWVDAFPTSVTRNFCKRHNNRTSKRQFHRLTLQRGLPFKFIN